ncbi:MAG TPA: AbrB/MazE/SpoVT family DNA-binding domain-containing protein [Opitutaceae bacterium]|nr:AbrB/MazE/SpoVT family DNA-binding domain-containing protein [Opitutaceae bacterium]
MTTKLSSKGQIVLPAAARRRLGLRAGAVFNCKVRGNEIVLELAEPPPTKPRFVRSKTSGLVSVAAVPGAAPLTTERVRAILADFP